VPSVGASLTVTLPAATLIALVQPVCGGPSGSFSKVTMLTPVPAVTRTAPGAIGVSCAFELAVVEATVSPSGVASLMRILEPGCVVTGVLQPAVARLLPALHGHDLLADCEAVLRALQCRRRAPLAHLDRGQRLRVGDGHLRVLPCDDRHLHLPERRVLR